jgi:protease IV
MNKRWLVCLALLPLAGCFNGFLITPVNTCAPLDETVVKDADHWCTCDKVALIDVSGIIMNVRMSGLISDGENPVSLFREKLDKAADDPSVKAVVLRINSPGGGVTASDIMYNDLIRFRAKTRKPVVACMMDICASGGYYLAVGCDFVYAHPSTVTGSIGVIIKMCNAEGLCKLLGVESDNIKSGPNKDIGNPAKKMTEEQRAIMQGLVDSFYDRFVEVVATGRGMSPEQVRKIADGRVYSAPQAAALGLIDEIGYLEDAIDQAKLLAGIRDADVVAYDRETGCRHTMYASAPHIPSEIKVKLEVPGLNLNALGGATFLYLWQPDAQ